MTKTQLKILEAKKRANELHGIARYFVILKILSLEIVTAFHKLFSHFFHGKHATFEKFAQRNEHGIITDSFTQHEKFHRHSIVGATLAILFGVVYTIGGFLVPATHYIHAASLLVNDNGDAGDGVCDSSCTLRDAITTANGSAGADAISFNAAMTITPTTPLPAITEQLSINGDVDSNGVPDVVIDGTSAGAGNGLTITSDSNAITGLVIENFSGTGIAIEGSSNTVVTSYIGTNSTGTAAAANTDGIVITDNGITPSSNNVIGGSSATERNIISGNTTDGIRLTGSLVQTNTIKGNYIGTNAAGDAKIPNTHGVMINASASDNTIGGTTSGITCTTPCNVLAGNGTDVRFEGAATANFVRGNFFGLRADGTRPIEWNHDGIGVSLAGGAFSNVIGGNRDETVSELGQGNVFAGYAYDSDANGSLNSGIAVYLESDAFDSGSSAGNSIFGNLIGLSPAGVNADTINNTSGAASADEINDFRNYQGISTAADFTQIGDGTALHRNAIAGNAIGVIVGASSGIDDVVINGNYVGLDKTGETGETYPGYFNPGGSSKIHYGMVIYGTTNIQIKNNVISGIQNKSITGGTVTTSALYLGNTGTTSPVGDNSGTTISGNKFGTDKDGLSAVANFLSITCKQMVNGTVGGALAGDRNIISASGGSNVTGGVFSATNAECHDNAIRNNYFGTDVTGNTALANQAGITLRSVTAMQLIDNVFGESTQFNIGSAQNITVTGNKFAISANGNTEFATESFGVASVDQSSSVTFSSNEFASSHGLYITTSHDVDVTNNAFGTDLAGNKTYSTFEAVMVTNSWNTNITGNLIKNGGIDPVHLYLVGNSPFAYAGNDYKEILGTNGYVCNTGQKGIQTIYYDATYGQLTTGAVCAPSQAYNGSRYVEPTPPAVSNIKAYLITISGLHYTFLVGQTSGGSLTCSLIAAIQGGTCDKEFNLYTLSGTTYTADTLPAGVSVATGYNQPFMEDNVYSAGISIFGANSTTLIQNNQIISNTTERGIAIIGGEGVTVDANTITNNTEGINLISTTGNTLTSNTITNNGDLGIELSASTLNEIGQDTLGNTITDHNLNGIALLSGSDQNTVFGNTSTGNGNAVTVNGAGLYIDESSNNEVYDNILNDNVRGVSISSSDTLFSQGNIIGDTAAGRPNTINSNSSSGILLQNAGTQNNNVVGNTISSNGGQGIDNNTTHSASEPTPVNGDNFIDSNAITLNTLHGIRNYGASPKITTNTLTQNAKSGISSIVNYGADTSPTTASDDTLSVPIITGNTFNGNQEYGIYSLDTAPSSKATLDTDNTFDNNNVQGRVRQDWYGLVDVTNEGSAQDAASVSIKDSSDADTLASATSASSGYAPNSASLTDVQTWQVIPEFQVSPTGTLQQYGPHKVHAAVTDDSETVNFDYNGVNDSGETGPSGFGNINGRYQVSLVNITKIPNTINGTVFIDSNENGTKDSGESGKSGVTVTLYKSTDTTYGNDSVVGTTTTETDGNYQFTGVVRGNYFVLIEKPSGYDETTSNPAGIITFASENQTLTRDFGVAIIPVVTTPGGTIRGTIFEDTNKNMTHDSGELVLSNITVSLYADSNGNGTYDSGVDQFLTSRTSNSSGVYRFIGIHLRNYFLRVDVPSNRSLTTENSPTDLLVLDTDGKTIAENFGLSQATATPEPEPEPEPEPNPRPKPGVGGGVISIINDITGGSVPGIVAPRTGASNVNSLIAIAAAGLAIVNFLLAAGSSFPMLLRLLLDLFTEPLMALFGSKKQPWGKVFDSITNLPIDLGIVRLYDANTMKLTATAVTDRTGRFKFFPKKGFYVAKADKLGYVFPSSLLKSAPTYQKPNYYFGEKFTISDMDQTFNRDIPIDRDNAEDGEKVLLKLRSKQALHTVFAYSGIVISIVNMIILLSWLTFGFFVLHVLLFLFFWRITRPRKPKAWGIVYDEETKKPISGAIVRIFDQRFGRLLDAAISNRNGKFGFLIGPSTYYLSIEAKGYIFPGTRKSSHKDYIGGSIEIKDANQVISYDIPLKKRPE